MPPSPSCWNVCAGRLLVYVLLAMASFCLRTCSPARTATIGWQSQCTLTFIRAQATPSLALHSSSAGMPTPTPNPRSPPLLPSPRPTRVERFPSDPWRKHRTHGGRDPEPEGFRCQSGEQPLGYKECGRCAFLKKRGALFAA